MSVANVIFDGTNFCRRIYEACPNKADVLRSCEASLKRALSEAGFPPKRLVVFDEAKSTWRHRVHPEYKAGRAEAPLEFTAALPAFKTLFERHHFKVVSDTTREADDIVADLVRSVAGKTHIYSTDKDFLQLVTDDIHVVNHFAKIILDPAGVVARYGVPPSAMADWLALVGDSADNIPGVPKVGHKTATKLLQEWQTLEQLLDNAETVKGVVGENLRAHKETARLAKRLVLIGGQQEA